jgi:hypothetical protein
LNHPARTSLGNGGGEPDLGMREEPVAGQVEQEVEVVADDDDAFQVRAAQFDPELDALAGAIRRL